MTARAQNATDDHLYATYARAPIAFERGEGAWLVARDGRRVLDFAAGIAVSSLGHAHPHLVETLKDQAEKLWHVSNLYEVPEQERLADRLCAASFADRVFFANSGTEAIECAIKTARRYHYARGDERRTRIVTVEGAFHGRTLAALAAGGQKKYLEGYGTPVDGFDQVPFGDHEALTAAVTDETAAILIEPIQGEGGIRPVPTQCLKGLREMCDERGILLVFDEIQTGMGRTGRLFAHEWAGVAPDVMALAKGMGGGFPMGACLATEEAASGMAVGSHGTTFGGNPLAMAIGNAVLDVLLEEGFLDRVRRVSGALRQRLSSVIDGHPDLIETVRGEGLMLGLVCRVPNMDVVAAARDASLILAPAGDNVARLLPPLIVGEEEVTEACDRLDAALSSLANAEAA